VITFASLFSCAGGADLGAIQTGCTTVGAVELDPYPAALHRANFDGEMREENILDTPLNAFTDVDFLWASPSCKSFSSAKENAGERQADVAIAKKVAALIGSIKPRYFALENVRGYLYQPEEKLEELLSLEAEEQGFTLKAPTVKTRKKPKARDFTESFGVIYRQLESMGYNLHYDIYDAANYGACQNRDRLILRASRDELRDLGQIRSKMSTLWLPKWNGWYDAIADLLPSCKLTHLTEKQLEALYKAGIDSANPKGKFILERTGYGHGRLPQLRTADEPTWTIRSATGCDEKGGYRSPITALLEQADVRALDYRCLARFQGFPDSYKWGKSAGKNCEAIGNAVEVGMARSVLESMI
jgi:DNA (cytosine-5)-methyltransferase 1